MKTEEFEVDIQDDSKVYRLTTLEGKFGPASCWDLHVKAYLDVFGRKTTLMQADHDTTVWISNNAKRLLKTKKKLIETLSKYERVPEVNEPHRPYDQMHLRTIMNSLTRLKGKLASHRPQIAAKFQI